MLKIKRIIFLGLLFTIVLLDANAQNRKNKIIGVFSQKILYRFTIVEFKSDFTFDYHVMSLRAHRQTSGKYEIIGDTIILNSFKQESVFDFHNDKWLIVSRNEILVSNKKNDKKELWSILKRDKGIKYIPTQTTDLALKIDSIRVNKLFWERDTNNYDSELRVIIREPLPPKKPMVLLNGKFINYDFQLNYYTLQDIDTIIVKSKEEMWNFGFDGEGMKNGLIIVNTKKKTER